MINRVLLSFAFVATLAFSASALAAPGDVPGCNPQVTDAMVKKNDALVGYDKAVIEETFDKPDSVLAMTCFNKAGGLDSSEGGKIFSEDFSVPMKDIVEPWLTAFFDEFDDAAGSPTGGENWMPAAYAAAATTLDTSGGGGTASKCGYVEKWWQEDSTTGGTNLGYKNKGVQQKIPFITLDMLRGNGAPAGAGADFLLKWNQAAVNDTNKYDPFQTIKTNLDTALTALPLPTMPAAGFVTDNTICAVLVKGGVTCP